MLIHKSEWLEKVKYWKNKWTQFPPEIEDDSNGVSLYKVVQVLNQNLKEDSCLVSDAGSSGYILGQGLELKEGQRWILDGGQMGMGAWQASIGVCLARNKKDTIVVTGDGSIMTGIESLAVIKENKLPIKFFILCNNGYLSIRNSQIAFYNNRIFGTDKEHGLFFPDLKKIANSYELKYIKIDSIKDLENNIDYIMNINEAIICEIRCNPDQKITPALAMKDGKTCGLEQMWPFLSNEELENEMIKDD